MCTYWQRYSNFSFARCACLFHFSRLYAHRFAHFDAIFFMKYLYFKEIVYLLFVLWQLFFACLLLLYCSRACVYARKESFAVVLVSRLTNSTAFLRNGSFFFVLFSFVSFRVWRALHFSMAITQTSMTTVWPLQIKIGKRERKKARNE